MKKICLVILIILVFLVGGCQQGTVSDDESQVLLDSISEDAAEETSTEQDDDCNIILCLSGTKEIHCTDKFSECANRYDECRMVSCDPELASDPPEETVDVEEELDVEDVVEEEASLEACGETRNLCRVDVEPEESTEEAGAYETLVCVGDYPACVEKYGDCDCGAPVNEKCCCFTELGSYQQKSVTECEQCVDSKKCDPSYEDLPECDSTKNTCYYMTEPLSIEKQYIDSTLVAFTCESNFEDCTARYGKCECGLSMDACTERVHDCLKGAELNECSGNLDFCLRKNDDCSCGKIQDCEKTVHECYIGDERYECGGDYSTCVRRYDKCLCGKPGQGCTDRKHRCFNSNQATTTYEQAEEEICEGFYYDCAKDYDWCECGTDDLVDYSCPLMQHSCYDIVCNGEYDDCVKKYGECDCGITFDERELIA
ncbi:hypothetical protein ACFL96_11040 [Thermoproteota archaeon]